MDVYSFDIKLYRQHVGVTAGNCCSDIDSWGGPQSYYNNIEGVCSIFAEVI